MRTRKRIEITIDTERLLVTRRGLHSATIWCARCKKRVRSLTPDQAAITARVSTRAIFRSVEAGRLHYLEAPDGFSLICLNSLSSASFDS